MDCLVKERFRKTYRHPLVDEKLTNRRVVQVVDLGILDLAHHLFISVILMHLA